MNGIAGVFRTQGIVIVLALAARLACGGETAVTIGQTDYALVCEQVELTLEKGLNKVQIKDLPDALRPESVMLKDPSGKFTLRIREQDFQNYAEDVLLSACEGLEVDLLPRMQTMQTNDLLKGKIIRGPYTLSYGSRAYGRSMRTVPPVFEVNGKLMVTSNSGGFMVLLPLDAISPRTLSLVVESDTAGTVKAELAYETGGLGWTACYNVTTGAKPDEFAITGVATIENASGKAFQKVRAKLMSGDVTRPPKFDPNNYGGSPQRQPILPDWAKGMPSQSPDRDLGTRQTFTLPGSITLKGGQPKVVEFLRAPAVKATPACVYDGLKVRWERYSDYSGSDDFTRSSDFGTQCNTQVWIIQEVANSAANGLGMTLPEGTMRMYRRTEGGFVEYMGDSAISSTPPEGKLRIFSSVVGELSGERVRTAYKENRDGQNRDARSMDETFRITLQNAGKQESAVTVVEHLYRSPAFTITTTTHKYFETGKQTIEFPVKVPAGGEVAVEYMVTYPK